MPSFNILSHLLRGGSILAVALWLTACAGVNPIAPDIDPDETSGAVVIMGMSVEGANVPELGQYYRFDFVSEADETVTVYRRPTELQNEIVFTELSPGRWTLESFRALSRANQPGFVPISSRPREVYLTFDVSLRHVHILDYQLTIKHEREDNGRIVTHPSITRLTDLVHERIDDRVELMDDVWRRVDEPVGIMEEREGGDSPGFFEQLFN